MKLRIILENPRAFLLPLDGTPWNPESLKMIGKTFHYDLDILERHLDTFGHVNNSKYLEILEEARWDLITQNGYGLEEIKISGKGPVILQVNLKFKKELRLREKIRVETTTVSYTKKLGTLRQVIVNGAGDICAEADFTVGLFDLVARKLILPTQRWLDAMGINDPAEIRRAG